MNKLNQTLEGVKVGDIFNERCVWYGEHNFFYQVVAIKGQHSVVLREINKGGTYNSNLDGIEYPIKDSFRTDETITKRVFVGEDYSHQNRPYVNFRKYESGWLVKGGETFDYLCD